VNTRTRAETFTKLFGQSFGISTTTTSNRPSPFDAHFQAVLGTFKTGWISQCKHQEYCTAFSMQRYQRLLKEEKARHSIQECTACALQHADLQQAFPGPTYEPPDIRSLYQNASTSWKAERATTRKVLQHVNAYHDVHISATVELFMIKRLAYLYATSTGDVWPLCHLSQPLHFALS